MTIKLKKERFAGGLVLRTMTGHGPLAYEMGVTRSFGRIDIGSHGLVRGWATPEDSHVWNDGNVSEILIKSTPGAPVRSLLIEGQPYIRPQQPTQDLQIFGNGLMLDFRRFSHSSSQVAVAVSVPGEVNLAFNDAGLLRLVMVMPNAVSPSDIGAGDDSRQLAFCFQTLLLSDQ